MLSSLSLFGFRNLNRLQWSLAEGSHLLLGGNGAGKTSLLEAIYLVATTRSFRTSNLRECLRVGGAEEDTEGVEAPAFGVSATTVGDRRAHLELRWSGGSTRRELDSKAVPLAKYLEPLPVVVWSAQDADVLSGSHDRRRRMLDRGLVSEDLSRLGVVSRYRQCLRQKRELLRRGQAGIEEWNHLLAQAASDLARERSSYVEVLSTGLREGLARSGLDFPPLALHYRPSPPCALDGTEAIEEALQEEMSEERRRRRPLVGPHLDRLLILWGEKDVSEIASAGERKSLGLLLLVAQFLALEAAGRTPVVLADDVDSELDTASLQCLWRVLSEARQVIVSSNRPEVWKALEVSHRWSVRGGSLDPCV